MILVLVFNQIYQRFKSTRGKWIQSDSDEGGGDAALHKFHVICREHAEAAIRIVSSPPAFINHLDAGDDVIWVKRDLRVISWEDTNEADQITD